jgi:dephospho-CoA kinase
MEEGFGKGTITDVMRREILQSRATFVLYDAIRFESDLALIRSEKQNLTVHITADSKLRYERTLRRRQKIREEELTFEEFLALEQRPTEIDIPKFGASADFTIVNNRNLDELKNAVEKFAQFYALPRLQR